MQQQGDEQQGRTRVGRALGVQRCVRDTELGYACILLYRCLCMKQAQAQTQAQTQTQTQTRTHTQTAGAGIYFCNEPG